MLRHVSYDHTNVMTLLTQQVTKVFALFLNFIDSHKLKQIVFQGGNHDPSTAMTLDYQL